MYPSIRDQLCQLLSRSDIKEVFWDHLHHQPVEGYLIDIYDGTAWTDLKQQPVEGTRRNWFSERDVFECAFVFNRYGFVWSVFSFISKSDITIFAHEIDRYIDITHPSLYFFDDIVTRYICSYYFIWLTLIALHMFCWVFVSDGFAPFHKQTYSVTAFYLTLANLPRKIRNLPENIILVLAIFGIHGDA